MFESVASLHVEAVHGGKTSTYSESGASEGKNEKRSVERRVTEEAVKEIKHDALS